MEKKKDYKKFFVDSVLPYIVGIGIVVAFVNIIGRPLIIQGSSMYPTLKDGDFGFGGIMHKNTDIERDDIVSLKTNDSSRYIIKRVVGLPGETIESDGENIYINGEPYIQDYLDISVYTEPFYAELGDDEYFVLGDNRENSRDSRSYGTFNREDFVTNGLFVLTFENFGFKN